MQPDGNNILCKTKWSQGLDTAKTISALDFDLAKVQLFHSSFADAVDEMASDFFSYTQFHET